MKRHLINKIALIVQSFILVLMIIAGAFLEISTDADLTVIGFIKSHLSFFLVAISLLMVACYLIFLHTYRRIDQFNENISTCNCTQQKKTLKTLFVVRVG